MRPAPASNIACLTCSRWLSGMNTLSWYTSIPSVAALLDALALVEALRELIELPRLDGPADGRHMGLIEAQVVNGVELRPHHFVAAVEVVQVGAAEIAAGVAVAARIQRAGV